MAANKTFHKQAVAQIKEGKGTLLDKILYSYLDEANIILTPQEEKIRERWARAISLLTNGYSPEKTVPILRKAYQISVRQAYRDIKSAIAVYGDVTQTSRQGQAQVMYELAYKIYALAMDEGEMGEANKAWKNMYLAQGLDKPEKEDPIGDIEPHQFIIHVQASTTNGPETIDITNISEVDQQQQQRLSDHVENMEISIDDLENLLNAKERNKF